MRVIVDTGPLIALLNNRDQYHAWSVRSARNLEAPLFTCEAVLTEAHFLLGNRTHDGSARLNELLGTGRLDVSYRAFDHLDMLSELMSRYADVPMSFADACLVRMSESVPSRVFTIDRGFQTYRTSSGRRIPLLAP